MKYVLCIIGVWIVAAMAVGRMDADNEDTAAQRLQQTALELETVAKQLREGRDINGSAALIEYHADQLRKQSASQFHDFLER